MITEDSKIEFHKLRYSSYVDEHNLLTVVRWNTDDSLKIDQNIVTLILLLKRGKTVGEAAKSLDFSSNIIITVLHMLENAHFFKSIDQVSVDDRAEKIKPWFVGIDRKWFQWVLYKPLIIGILLFSVIGIILGIFMNGIPSYKAFFWTSDIFTVFVSLFVVEIILLVLHESCHFFATKAVGGEAVMRVSYRYIFIVAETESYHLAIVPKKLRYAVYIAGMTCDLFIIALLYWFFAITQIFNIHIGVLHNFLAAIILTELIGIAWEFNVFLETDIYNFLSEYLGIENLRNDALKSIDEHAEKWKKILLFPVKRLLRFISNDFTKESDDLRLLSKSSKKKLSIYILILIGGLIVTTMQYIFYSIPRDFTFVYQSVKDIERAMQPFNSILFFKSLVIIVLVILDYFLLFYLRIRGSKKVKKIHNK